MSTQLEEIIEASTTKKIFLSTRITQKEHKMLDEMQAWLQTERSLSTVSRQETIMYTIRMGYEYMQLKLAQMDGQIESIMPTNSEQKNVDPVYKLIEIATK